MAVIFRKEEWGPRTSRLTTKGRIVQESGPAERKPQRKKAVRIDRDAQGGSLRRLKRMTSIGQSLFLSSWILCFAF